VSSQQQPIVGQQSGSSQQLQTGNQALPPQFVNVSAGYNAASGPAILPVQVVIERAPTVPRAGYGTHGREDR